MYICNRVHDYAWQYTPIYQSPWYPSAYESLLVSFLNIWFNSYTDINIPCFRAVGTYQSQPYCVFNVLMTSSMYTTRSLEFKYAGLMCRSKYPPVQVSIGASLHRTKVTLVHVSTGPSTHWSRFPPVQVYTCPSIHQSYNPQVQISTDPSIHRSKDPPVQVSTGPNTHGSKYPPVQFPTSSRIY